ncbi:MAG: hypothetical protein HYV02_07910 [Deltaproteobacteria bacterium]|nr:hypothetical protein [Deltaproteobacteria bacterium]
MNAFQPMAPGNGDGTCVAGAPLGDATSGSPSAPGGPYIDILNPAKDSKMHQAISLGCAGEFARALQVIDAVYS